MLTSCQIMGLNKPEMRIRGQEDLGTFVMSPGHCLGPARRYEGVAH